MDYNKEVTLKVKKYIDLEIISEDKSRNKLAKNYLTKARHNFLVSKFIEKGTDSKEVLEILGFDDEFKAYDWIINTSYYAMYMVAQAVLASINIKCENHTATPYALEYYFVMKDKLEQEFVDLLRKNQDLIDKDDVDKLRSGKETRIKAQYDVLESMEKEMASTILEDTGKFIERMEKLFEVISK
ncbi:MAG: HEPN domain-containing protein [Nanoarchaeota archaeon]|nr:HEPN domain-containing protein [Nanoarchaeota archaeon]MBU1631925.1 HEPN domain-containing protein [Nanoarchaeota archaeon]MBU1875947.1 HEPN domain-containing protein [Nanoarchaeota archaeon]